MYANSTLTLLFWQVGRRINEHILQNKRADYGKQIVVTLARQLTEKYGRNFEEKNLRRMLQFAEQFSDEQIVVPLGPTIKLVAYTHSFTDKKNGSQTLLCKILRRTGMG